MVDFRFILKNQLGARQGVSEDGDEERWISTREACISAAGSILMTAIGNPLLLEDPPPDELVDLVLECAAPTVACSVVFVTETEQPERTVYVVGLR